MDHNVDTYKDLTIKEILKELDIVPSQRRYNLKKVETQAIKTLKENKNIVIKPADKGGVVVIKNKEDYILEGL